MPRSTTDLPALQAAVEQISDPWPYTFDRDGLWVNERDAAGIVAIVNAIKPLLRLAEAAVALEAARVRAEVAQLVANTATSVGRMEAAFAEERASNEAFVPVEAEYRAALDALSPKGEDR